MLEINQLIKTYDSFSLGPIDLIVDAGCALGIVGSNGAGKTTLFRSIMGTVRRNGGTVLLNGEETKNNNGTWKQHIGYIGDYSPFFDNWSGQKNLATLAKYYPAWSHARAIETAARLNLDLAKKVKQYSTGNRTKLAIVAALSRQASLLILDEPTNGLDPVARDVFMDLLHEQMEPGNTAILYATHHIAEIENLADRLVFISDGSIMRDEIKEDLSQTWKHITFRSESLLPSIPHVVKQQGDHPYQEIISDNGDITEAFLREKGAENIESSHLSIEKITVEILKSSARELNHV